MPVPPQPVLRIVPLFTTVLFVPSAWMPVVQPPMAMVPALRMEVEPPMLLMPVPLSPTLMVLLLTTRAPATMVCIAMPWARTVIVPLLVMSDAWMPPLFVPAWIVPELTTVPFPVVTRIALLVLPTVMVPF